MLFLKQSAARPSAICGTTGGFVFSCVYRCGIIGNLNGVTKSLPLEGKVSGAELSWLNVTEKFRA